MIIEQSKEQVDDSVSFHRHSEIGFLRLARARIWSRDRITRIAPGDVNFDITFKPGAWSLEDRGVFLETEFIFSMNEIFESQDESKPLIVIECCFEAEYQLVSDFTPSEKQIEAFRAANAVFNCWPFFREFVQTSVTRMHFPPPPVPFLRLSRKTEVARKATQKQAIQKQIPQPPD
jgi:hypothetical protein